MSEEKQTPDSEQKLHDCGYVEDTFACKIRHQSIGTLNSEARRHDKYLRDVRQDQVYGL